MEPKLPVYHQETAMQNVPTAPGYQPYQQMQTVSVPEVQHHGNNSNTGYTVSNNNNNDDNDDDDKVVDETKIILPIDPGDVPQQKYLSVSFRLNYKLSLAW